MADKDKPSTSRKDNINVSKKRKVSEIGGNISEQPSTSKNVSIRDPKNLSAEEMEALLDYEDSGSSYVPSDMDNSSSSEESDDDIIPVFQTVQPVQSPVQPISPSSNKVWMDTTLIKDIPFQSQRKLLVQIPNGSPIDYFKLLFDKNITTKIIQETNKNAEDVFTTKDVGDRARITEWKELNETDLNTFLGLYLHMGNIKINRLADYWRTDELYNIPCFKNYMARNRFLLIFRHLHFSSNLQISEGPVDQLHKIRPLIDHFNKKMNSVYSPGKELSLDEAMILWRGRLVFRQYVKGKRHKYGVKIYMLTEPDGTVLKILVYSGSNDAETGGKGHTSKVVMYLMKERLNLGHSLYMDNFYNSFDLASQLLANNTYCSGTLRINRQNNPTAVMSAKLKRGEMKVQHCNGVSIGKWRDKSDVLFITTEHNCELVETRSRRGTVKEKPLPIIKYNEFMGGIDQQDQMMSYYGHDRKTIRWYKKIGLHIIQLLLLNSYYLYNRYSGQKMSLYNFRHEVIKGLLTSKPTKKRDTDVLVSGEHVPTKIKKEENAKRIKRKACKQCSKIKVRRDTIYECTICPNQPALCLGKCFIDYHTSK